MRRRYRPFAHAFSLFREHLYESIFAPHEPAAADELDSALSEEQARHASTPPPPLSWWPRAVSSVPQRWVTSRFCAHGVSRGVPYFLRTQQLDRIVAVLRAELRAAEEARDEWRARALLLEAERDGHALVKLLMATFRGQLKLTESAVRRAAFFALYWQSRRTIAMARLFAFARARSRKREAFLRWRRAAAAERVGRNEAEIERLSVRAMQLEKENAELRERLSGKDKTIHELEGKCNKLTHELMRLQAEHALMIASRKQLLALQPVMNAYHALIGELCVWVSERMRGRINSARGTPDTSALLVQGESLNALIKRPPELLLMRWVNLQARARVCVCVCFS